MPVRQTDRGGFVWTSEEGEREKPNSIPACSSTEPKTTEDWLAARQAALRVFNESSVELRERLSGTVVRCLEDRGNCLVWRVVRDGDDDALERNRIRIDAVVVANMSPWFDAAMLLHQFQHRVYVGGATARARSYNMTEVVLTIEGDDTTVVELARRYKLDVNWGEIIPRYRKAARVVSLLAPLVGQMEAAMYVNSAPEAADVDADVDADASAEVLP